MLSLKACCNRFTAVCIAAAKPAGALATLASATRLMWNADVGTPILPSPFRSCLKTVSSDSNAGLVPDVGARILELKLPLLSSAHTPYESAPGNLQQRSYPVAVC